MAIDRGPSVDRDEPCPARGAGLTHITSGSWVCIHCGAMTFARGQWIGPYSNSTDYGPGSVEEMIAALRADIKPKEDMTLTGFPFEADRKLRWLRWLYRTGRKGRIDRMPRLKVKPVIDWEAFDNRPPSLLDYRPPRKR